MTHFRMRCPHCDGELRMQVDAEAVGAPRRGPEPRKRDPEVEAFIVTAIDDYKLAFGAVAKLLEEREILAPSGGKRWFPASVRREYERVLELRQGEGTHI